MTNFISIFKQLIALRIPGTASYKPINDNLKHNITFIYVPDNITPDRLTYWQGCPKNI